MGPQGANASLIISWVTVETEICHHHWKVMAVRFSIPSGPALSRLNPDRQGESKTRGEYENQAGCMREVSRFSHIATHTRYGI